MENVWDLFYFSSGNMGPTLFMFCLYIFSLYTIKYLCRVSDVVGGCVCRCVYPDNSRVVDDGGGVPGMLWCDSGVSLYAGAGELYLLSSFSFHLVFSWSVMGLVLRYYVTLCFSIKLFTEQIQGQNSVSVRPSVRIDYA